LTDVEKIAVAGYEDDIQEMRFMVKKKIVLKLLLTNGMMITIGCCLID